MGSFGGVTRLASSADAATTAKYYVGLLGNLTALWLYLWAIPTFWRIWKNGTVGQTTVFPYMAGVVNCLVWGLYGLPSVQKGSEIMMAVNAFGLLCMFVYSIVFLCFAGEERCFLLCYVLIVEIMVTGALGAALLIAPRTQDSQIKAIGVCGAISGSVMYVVPVVQDMIVVWNTSSVEHLPLWSVAVSLLNAVVWVIYARIPKYNDFTLAPNVVGVGCGLVVLSVFYFHRIWNAIRNAQAA